MDSSSSSSSEDEVQVLPQSPASNPSAEDDEVPQEEQKDNEPGTAPTEATGVLEQPDVDELALLQQQQDIIYAQILQEAFNAEIADQDPEIDVPVGVGDPALQPDTAPSEVTGPGRAVGANRLVQVERDSLYAQMLQESLDNEMAYPNPERIAIAHLDDSFSSGDDDYPDEYGHDDDDLYEPPATANVVRNSLTMALRNRNYHSEYDTDSDDEQVVNPRGLTLSEVNRLQTRNYLALETPALESGDYHAAGASSKRNYNKECIICAVEYKDGDVLRILPCRHEFHSKCVDKWLRRKAFCPLCRSIIDKDDHH